MRTKTALAIAVSSLIALGSELASAQTFVSDFETGFDGWQQQWHKEDTGGTDGVVTHTTVRGYLDGTSLKFDMGDGFGDDGTLWIEKQFDVSSTMPTHVELAFQLFNEFQSDFNTFQVKAAISTDNPEQQADFTTIGSTDSAEGWVPFSYSETVTSPTGQVWVALGIRVAWETHRDYWIDHVIVSTTAIPEPTSASLSMLGVAGLPLLLLGRSRRKLNRQRNVTARPTSSGDRARKETHLFPSQTQPLNFPGR